MQVAYLGPRGSLHIKWPSKPFRLRICRLLKRLQRLSRPTKRGSYLFRYSSRELD